MTAARQARRVAFYAPMKPPTHPTPSGDRRIAQLMLRALAVGGRAPFLASELRCRDGQGDASAQGALLAEADLEVERLLEDLTEDPPEFWFTYHCYYKAPDLIGPRVAGALKIPYLIAEPSHSPRRLRGAWSRFAELSDLALEAADGLLWSKPRDLPGLHHLFGPNDKRLKRLDPFLDAGEDPARRRADGPIRLLTIAMMREGDKQASYAALADALSHLDDVDWRLVVIGDGAAAPAVHAMFDDFRGRVEFSGMIADPALIRAAYEASELFVWPGVNEGFGMVYLEAQAAGLACLAEDRAGPRDVIHRPEGFPPPNDPTAFAAAIRRAAQDRMGLEDAGRAARRYVQDTHSLEAAGQRIAAIVKGL